MRPLAAVERFFERVVERPSARLFGARLQPIQLQRRLEREMESERMTASDRTLVPNRYALHLNPDDFASFSEFAGSLAAELADGALTYARARRYTLIDRPQVRLIPDQSIHAGDVHVVSTFVDGPEATTPPGTGRGAGAEPSTRTAVFEVPEIRAPKARIRLWSVGGREREVPVEGGLMTIGRARDNDLVLDDGRVSRHHARLQSRAGSLVLTDLDSTNGTTVNGARIREVVLGDGDRIEIGDSVLVVEAATGSQ